MSNKTDVLIRRLWSECRAIGLFDEAEREDLADMTRQIAHQTRTELCATIAEIEAERDAARAENKSLRDEVKRAVKQGMEGARQAYQGMVNEARFQEKVARIDLEELRTRVAELEAAVEFACFNFPESAETHPDGLAILARLRRVRKLA